MHSVSADLVQPVVRGQPNMEHDHHLQHNIEQDLTSPELHC